MLFGTYTLGSMVLLLLYAGPLILMSQAATAPGLQNQLNALASCCEQPKLTIAVPISARQQQ